MISSVTLDLLASLPSSSTPGLCEHLAASFDSPDLLQHHQSELENPLPYTTTFSSASTAVVPLIAHRVSLPESLTPVPMMDVLPPNIAAAYTEAASTSLLRDSTVVFFENILKPLPPPRIAGSRSEYVKLIGRMWKIGMSSFTSTPKAVNGVFTVAKDADGDRLIIDARPCNRLFIPSPNIALPNPSHLVQLHIPKGEKMFVSKSDLSNYYHYMMLVEWLRPYLCLPPLTSDELTSIGAPLDACFPMCLTLAMGFSHAVYLATSAHQHILYRNLAVKPEDSILTLTSPTLTHDRVLHGIVVDDFFCFSLNKSLANRTMESVLATYAKDGFLVKASKVVMPTTDVVKVVGFDIDGTNATIALPPDSMHSLIRSTLAILRAPTVTGIMLAHIIGRWTWILMLRRPCLAVLQHVYTYCRAAQRRPFHLWRTVRRELHMLLSLLPFLHCRLDATFFRSAIASDASELAGGVVISTLTPDLHSQLWPLCSSRHHAVMQAKLNAERKRDGDIAILQPDLSAASVLTFDEFYSTVKSTTWRTIVSKAWCGLEHINALELRAALLAMHWVLSFPSSLDSRVYLLLDSTVSFFTLWKGRSSSPKLLLIIRKISALLLAGGLALLPGWVPSEINPADAPSRLLNNDCSTLSRVAA